MQVWPALVMPPQTAASAAAGMSASASTISASLPPASITTGTRFSAQAAMHLLRGGGGAGERHLAHAGPAQRGAHVAEAVHRLQHRLFRHHLGERVDQPLPDDRGVLAGLEDHRVAGRERAADRAERGDDRIVPRADHADHAVGLVFEVAGVFGDHQAGAGAARAEHPLGVARRPVEVLDRGDRLEDGVGVRLAGSPGWSARASSSIRRTMQGAPAQQPARGGRRSRDPATRGRLRGPARRPGGRPPARRPPARGPPPRRRPGLSR